MSFAYELLASLFVYFYSRGIRREIFQISYFGVGPTEIRIGLLWYRLAILAIGKPFVKTQFGPLSPLDGIAVMIFVTVFVSFLSMALVRELPHRRAGKKFSTKSTPPANSWQPRLKADGKAAP